MLPMIKRYFVCANSSQGFISFFQENLNELNKVFILKGGPGTGKSTLMKRIGNHFYNLGYDVDYIHCSSDVNSLDGIIIPKLSVGIVDGTAPHVIEPTAPGAIEQYVNLGIAWDLDYLAKFTDLILTNKKIIANSYSTLYKEYADALTIHDEWEKIYIHEMDFKKAEAFKQLVCDTLVNYPPVNHQGTTKHRFFGASTPTGSVDFINQLTESLEKRYFIKGRPGSGKSTLMKAIAAKAEKLGYDVEIYHCSFDPKSLDMVLIPDLKICFFDSTAPHEYFPTKETDEVIDTYKAFIKPGTDEANEVQLTQIASNYKDTVGRGVAALQVAKNAHAELEKIYIEATNFEIIDAFYEQIKHEIEKLID